jgi:hypothetical protein
VPVGNAIGRITSILCIPYGYTVTLWCAGALAVTKFGLPSVPDVVLFALGAVAAFVALAAIGGPHLDAEVPMRVPWVVVINVLPVVVTLILLAVPNELLGRRLGFVASSLVATGAYIVGLAIMIRIAVFRERGAGGGRVAEHRGHPDRERGP